LRDVPQFRFSLNPSRRLAGAVLSAHAAAAVCAALALEAPFGSRMAALLLALGAHAAWQHALLRSARSIRAIEIAEAGEAVLERADGARLAGQISRRRHVSRHWVAMSVRGTAANPILVTNDMLDAGAFRALRMWALWNRLPRCSAARQGQ
jgi:hypothetical protein